eukprot:760297-Hanusia_phi.AAC.4
MRKYLMKGGGEWEVSVKGSERKERGGRREEYLSLPLRRPLDGSCRPVPCRLKDAEILIEQEVQPPLPVLAR